MVERAVIDLAEFGKNYRTLFIIGECDCSNSPRADRLIIKGRLLLTDVVSELYEIRKVSKTTVVEVRDLKNQAHQKIRPSIDDPEVKLIAEDIAHALSKTFNKFESCGSKRLAKLTTKMIEYRDETVAPEVSALGANLKALRDGQKSQGRIATMADKLVPKFISRRNPDALNNEASVIVRVESELSAAQDIQRRAGETRSNLNVCALDWKNLQGKFEKTHCSPILLLLSATEITPQSKGKINHNFQSLINILTDLNKEMDIVYDDIEAQFGPDRDMNKRVQAFQLALPHVSAILKQLASSKNVVERQHQEQFQEEILCLAKYCLAQLRRIQGVLSAWVIYTRSNSTEPIPFVDDAHEMGTKSLELFERNSRTSAFRLRSILDKGKKSKKGGNADGTGPAEILSLTSPSEVLRALDDLEETFFAITGFSIRFAMDLMFYDRRLQDDSNPQSLSELLTNPFVVEPGVAAKAHEVLEDEIDRLQKIAGPDSD